MSNLLSKDVSNAKLAKTHDVFGRDWETLILYLAPATVASSVSLCPASTPACRAGCLFYAGRAAIFENVNKARVRKTRQFVERQAEFLTQLRKELTLALKRTRKAGKSLAVRLNGTSDIDWVKLGIIGEFPEIQFYDYTKVPARAAQWARGELPSNYHLTFSRSDTNAVVAQRLLAMGANVAVVVGHKVKVDFEALGKVALNGDLHDARFLDGKGPTGRLVVLKAKGPARGTDSDTGFVLNAEGFSRLMSSITAANVAA